MPLRLALLCGLLTLAGCSSTRQIRTAPPRPAVATPPLEGAAPRGRLAVAVEAGPSALPDGAAALRFRVAEVRLKPAGAPWVMLPADPNAVEVAAGRPLRIPILVTDLPSARYDSLALVLSDVFVQYDANAGGPLTMPRGAPLRLPLALDVATGETAALHLRFEPAAALSRSEDCRWFFLPFFEVVGL
ncbi:MAG: hypothetical protein R3247_13500 [Rhodothermales bacterium]|nr:hypothetical protein [Rhodothermales bacterium]